MGRPASAPARLIGLAAALAACGPTPAVVRVVEPLPPGERVLTLTAAQQRPAIEQALRVAGFVLDDRPRRDALLLRVTLGIDQGSQACGTLNNVRYALRRDRQTLMVVEAKGWTGSCQPNVFDEASVALRRAIDGAVTDGDQR